jgi:mono/diheme cytochrome c family protein
VKLALVGTVVLLTVCAGAWAGEPTISWTWFPVKETANAPPGKIEFDRACAVCHGAGPDRPGTHSLEVKYQGKLPALLEERTDLTPTAVRYFIRNGIAMMPRFRKTELNDQQVEAIAHYIGRAPER